MFFNPCKKRKEKKGEGGGVVCGSWSDWLRIHGGMTSISDQNYFQWPDNA